MIMRTTPSTYTGTSFHGYTSKEPKECSSKVYTTQHDIGFCIVGSWEGEIPSWSCRATYDGELDQNGMPTGEGEAVCENGTTIKGTWLSGNFNGYCKCSAMFLRKEAHN